MSFGFFQRKTVLAKNDYGEEYRFKVHNGNQIWLSWFGNPFPLKMNDDGTLTILKEGLKGNGKQAIGWTWRADDHSTQCPNADF